MKHSDLTKRAMEHFAALERKTIEVHEWGEGDEPAIIYAQPMTAEDYDALAKYENTMEWDVRVMVRKAVDAAGTPLFGDEDIMPLRKSASANLINRIAREIVAHTGLAVPDLKN